VAAALTFGMGPLVDFCSDVGAVIAPSPRMPSLTDGRSGERDDVVSDRDYGSGILPIDQTR
jgi:hypothetical protein